ncbi:MAG TPA: methylenetetrahydrofolate reductase C-terminal domain-containing protein [Massilibacterium sp.]|nr:methylenetetrahydrofolate reductase C-terminal domain-containing protein [Massilibacterium sp.]
MKNCLRNNGYKKEVRQFLIEADDEQIYDVAVGSRFNIDYRYAAAKELQRRKYIKKCKSCDWSIISRNKIVCPFSTCAKERLKEECS